MGQIPIDPRRRRFLIRDTEEYRKSESETYPENVSKQINIDML